MPFPGDLVKLQDGRWARFRRCQTPAGEAAPVSLLVAVELEERYQELLLSAERALDEYRAHGLAVQVRLEEGAAENPVRFTPDLSLAL
jgi:hypothetical protein